MADINPEQVVICHCADCQTFSSAPYRVSVFGVPSTNFNLAGSPKTYVKTGGSGADVLVAFCGDCGTALYSASNATEGPFNLRLGTIKQRRELTPKMQGFCGSGLPWATDIRNIHQIPDPDRA
ncbi:MAG: GFA family protein [Pseudomonadota bacterium]